LPNQIRHKSDWKGMYQNMSENCSRDNSVFILAKFMIISRSNWIRISIRISSSKYYEFSKHLAGNFIL